MDKRGNLRGKCLIDSCECSGYEVPVDGHNCSYCGDPPAKHLLIVNNPAKEPELESVNNNEDNCRDLNEVPESSVHVKPWENPALGWIDNPLRPTGKYFNSILPEFYNSFWPFYPDTKQFRAEFVIERSRQFTVYTQIESLRKRIHFLVSDNPACAGRLISADYLPKPGDRAIINSVQQNSQQLEGLIEKIEADLDMHDSSLFINGGRKIKSGRNCHHTFNNSKKVELNTLRARLHEINKKLEKSEEIYNDVWAKRYKPAGISEAKKKINNKFKAEKRKQRSMLQKVLHVFISLGGDAVGDCFSPAHGIPQITNLAIPLEELAQYPNLRYSLEVLVKEGCFGEMALTDVQLFLDEQMYM